MYFTASASFAISVDESLKREMDALNPSILEEMHIRYCAYVDKFSRSPYRFKGRRGGEENKSGEKKSSFPSNLLRDIGVLQDGILEKKGRTGIWTKRFFRIISSSASGTNISGDDRLEIYERKRGTLFYDYLISS
jgi:hypothetical protein